MEGEKRLGSVGIVGIVAVLLIGTVVTFTYKKFQERRATQRVAVQLKKGLNALAVDTMEPFRRKLVTSTDGCKLAVMAYSSAQQTDKLEWAAESCLENGINSLEVYEGLASVKDQQGDGVSAARTLVAASELFPNSAEPFLNLTKIYRKYKDDDHAVPALKRAVELTRGNHQLEFDALQYFGSLNRWADAKAMADLLRSADLGNPEARFVIAQAYFKAGDKLAAKSQIALADEALAKSGPALKAALHKKYASITN